MKILRWPVHQREGARVFDPQIAGDERDERDEMSRMLLEE